MKINKINIFSITMLTVLFGSSCSGKYFTKNGNKKSGDANIRRIDENYLINLIYDQKLESKQFNLNYNLSINNQDFSIEASDKLRLQDVKNTGTLCESFSTAFALICTRDASFYNSVENLVVGLGQWGLQAIVDNDMEKAILYAENLFHLGIMINSPGYDNDELMQLWIKSYSELVNALVTSENGLVVLGEKPDWLISGFCVLSLSSNRIAYSIDSKITNHNLIVSVKNNDLDSLTQNFIDSYNEWALLDFSLKEYHKYYNKLTNFGIDETDDTSYTEYLMLKSAIEEFKKAEIYSYNLYINLFEGIEKNHNMILMKNIMKSHNASCGGLCDFLFKIQNRENGSKTGQP